MSYIKFIKMHGLGNDFVICEKKDVGSNISSLAKNISHRNKGIGCDQFILIDRHTNEINMEIYNADGSSAQACGNATRCVAYLEYELTAKKDIIIKVMDKKLPCLVTDINDIAVNMGKVSFADNSEISIIKSHLKEYLSDDTEVTFANIGNPHLVIFDSNLSYSDMKILGPKFEKHNIFPEGANINFAKITDGIINLKVWERGTGFTYACGSGACATFASSHKLGFSGNEAIVQFELGQLKMKISEENEIIMNGPIVKVAEGKFYNG